MSPGVSQPNVVVQHFAFSCPESWKHYTDLFEKDDLTVVLQQRRAFAGLAVERLKQRRDKVVKVRASRVDKQRRQRNLVRHLTETRLLSGFPNFLAVLFKHLAMDTPMRSAAHIDGQQPPLVIVIETNLHHTLRCWWARQDLNLQPGRYERLALVIELRDRIM